MNRNPVQPDVELLETFVNPYPQRSYEILMEAPEFTCVCPKTGQPDFAVLRLSYIPGKKCLELKSFKIYLWSYRQHGAFHEAVINRILEDLVEVVEPRSMTLVGEFNVRGGIRTTVTARHQDRANPPG
ncbi:MAG: NADPH-dependent 7-cyano-7-deazaguanine reductase QueF [Magnetococcales bacterium]|nr:NADPH-dependent 7-cyano-7-deazaguanine reductase QueF [Magnetococcales bacterium]